MAAGFCLCPLHRRGLLKIQSQGLFAENMFAPLKGGDGMGGVLAVEGTNERPVHVVARAKFFHACAHGQTRGEFIPEPGHGGGIRVMHGSHSNFGTFLHQPLDDSTDPYATADHSDADSGNYF
jgi:hypothetical protein